MSLLFAMLAALQMDPILSDSINQPRPDGISSDSIFISQYIETALQSPDSITRHFIRPNSFIHADTLGFGYTFIQSARKTFYLLMSFKFVFHEGKLISFELHPQMPGDDAHRLIYRKFYSPLFQISDDGRTVIPFRWHAERVQAPIADKRFQLKNSKETNAVVLELMSPYIGTWYEAGDDLTPYVSRSRSTFDSVKDSLNLSDFVNLIHSINPGVRLMAIEYLRGATYVPGIDTSAIEHDAGVVNEECPLIYLKHGDVIQREDARTVLDRHGHYDRRDRKEVKMQ